VVEGWKHILILLTLEQMLSNVIIDNLMKMILASLLQYGGLYETNLTSKLITFGVDGASIFQEAKICVITQFKAKHARFMLGVLHCIAH
jgi:hypothetical protein